MSTKSLLSALPAKEQDVLRGDFFVARNRNTGKPTGKVIPIVVGPGLGWKGVSIATLAVILEAVDAHREAGFSALELADKINANPELLKRAIDEDEARRAAAAEAKAAKAGKSKAKPKPAAAKSLLDEVAAMTD